MADFFLSLPSWPFYALIVAGCMLAAVALAEIETAGPMENDP